MLKPGITSEAVLYVRYEGLQNVLYRGIEHGQLHAIQCFWKYQLA